MRLVAACFGESRSGRGTRGPFLVCLFVWCLGPKPRNTFFGRQHKVYVVCVVAMATACSPQLRDCAVRCNLHTSCSILFRLGGRFYTLKDLEGGKHFRFFFVFLKLQLWLWSNQSKTKHTHPSIQLMVMGVQLSQADGTLSLPVSVAAPHRLY